MLVLVRFRALVLVVFASVSLASYSAPAPSHEHFKVAVYITVFQVERMKDAAYLEKSWEELNSQVKVDKVYIETYRSGTIAEDDTLEAVKKFFASHGVETAGGIAYVGSGDNAGNDSAEAGDGQFVSMCYTDPQQRAYVKKIAEITAHHFDEIILDDFFFNNTKRDSDIAAKGNQPWTDFRLKLMDDVSRDLVIGPARAVNPRVHIIIKFPNWYEHFAANGYDLAVEPKLYDGIYTGTETRDPVTTDQHLQQYESYEIVRYFDNIAPQRNGGGWVDVYDTRYLDRYAEQLWDTALAKAPQVLLFQYSDLNRAAEMGNRKTWEDLPTSFTTKGLAEWRADTGAAGEATFGSAAGYALNRVNAVLGRLGNPMGIVSYKPVRSSGEDFLQNYLGMIGVPIEMRPEFPTDAHTVLLTEQAKADVDLVGKIKAQLERGGNVVVTAKLFEALEGHGIEDIVDLHATGNVLRVDQWWGGSGAGAGANLGEAGGILVPEIQFQTNDAWPVVRGTANGRGAPILLMDKYSKGILYVLVVPENANDLYGLPQGVLTQIREYLMARFPVWLDAPAKVSLFAYDNDSFVVESFLDTPQQVKIFTLGTSKRIRMAGSGETVEGKAADPQDRLARNRQVFEVTVQPHSFVAFTRE